MGREADEQGGACNAGVSRGAVALALARRQTISAKHATASDSMYGLVLMAIYLLADGMTSTTQERMFRGYTMSTYNQMLYVNLFSAGLSLLGAPRGGRGRGGGAAQRRKRAGWWGRRGGGNGRGGGGGAAEETGGVVGPRNEPANRSGTVR